MLKNILIVGIGLMLLALTYAWWHSYGPAKALLVTNFEECKALGYPVMETYPEQCKTPDGRLFISAVEPQQIQQ